MSQICEILNFKCMFIIKYDTINLNTKIIVFYTIRYINGSLDGKRHHCPKTHKDVNGGLLSV